MMSSRGLKPLQPRAEDDTSRFKARVYLNRSTALKDKAANRGGGQSVTIISQRSSAAPRKLPAPEAIERNKHVYARYENNMQKILDDMQEGAESAKREDKSRNYKL